ncbi:MAG: hypothetical protein AAFW46_01285 [Pseudomonadota bacterium]
MQSISIWESQISADLDQAFARLVAAGPNDFSRVGAEIAMESVALEAGLSPADLQAARANVDASALDAPIGYPAGEAGVLPTLQLVSLATSHSFFEDPYASLEHEDIDHQVAAALQTYGGAATRALGDAGQHFWQAVGAPGSPAEMNDAAFFDFIEAFPIDEFEWVWLTQKAAFVLLRSHEDKELPIDIGFGRADRADFDALRSSIAAPR